MGRNNGTKSEVKAARQLEVARLRVKGLSFREIVENLAGRKLVNPLTGEPWSLSILIRDGRELDAAWRKAAAGDIAAAKGRQLAEIQEARREAWGFMDLNQVRQLIKLEMELLGTEAPRRTEVAGPDGGPVVVRDETAEMSDDILRHRLGEFGRVAALLAAGGGGESPAADDGAAGDDSAGAAGGDRDAGGGGGVRGAAHADG